MLSVTEGALAHFSEMLAETEPPTALRVTLVDENLGLVDDVPEDGDVTFEHGGRVVLLVAGPIAKVLETMQLDFDQADGERILLTEQSAVD